MNLNDLLADLEKSSGIEKTASAAVENVKPSISAELAGVLEKKASVDLVKSAHAQGEELARELLSKLANEIQIGNAQMEASDAVKVVPTVTSGTVEEVLQGTVDAGLKDGATSDDRVDNAMDGKEIDVTLAANREAPVATQTQLNKEAQVNNSNLAKQIMEKLAQEFSAEVTTPAAASNVAGAAVPNLIQTGNAVMTAQADATVQGIGTAGTVDDLFQAIVARAKAQGGGSQDLINGEAAVPRDTIGASDEVEKAAAVSALCAEGLDFDSAVSLVKQAEEELGADAWEHEKVACMGALMEEGVSFNDAVELVKQAELDLKAAK